MSRGEGGGPPVSSAEASREPSTGTKPGGGGAGRVEAEWKQQREKPVVGTLPQGLVRPLQQSPQETAPATTGQRTPSTTSPKKIHAKRPRPMALL
jgi:hypothetical protein